MGKKISTTMDSLSSSNNQVEIAFELTTGTETITINEELLTNYQVAEARAVSEFLNQGYISKKVSFTTYHLDGLHLGDVIIVSLLKYKIISITEDIQKSVAKMNIVCERWEEQ